MPDSRIPLYDTNTMYSLKVHLVCYLVSFNLFADNQQINYKRIRKYISMHGYSNKNNWFSQK